MKSAIAFFLTLLSVDVFAQHNTGNRPLDTAAIHQITGVNGSWNNGEYKITIPQNGLVVVVDSFRIIPPMGLSSWVGFMPTSEGAMIMGDIVVTETDLKPVQREVIQQGLTITAIHNHFVRNHPNVMYMHVGGSGDASLLAKKVRSILDKVAESRGAQPAVGKVDPVQNTLDTAMLKELIGKPGEMSKGVFKQTIGRPDVELRDHGVPVSTFMGFNTWAAWQGTMEHAAVAGDFAMLQDEVEPVIKALISNGIEVVAVHNHMVHEVPKIFFLHYWGVGNARQLATALHLALEETGKKRPSSMKEMH